jgi:uncharacterized protein with NRDE domain
MPDPTKKSRGAVVRDALAAGSREAIREMLGALRPEDYNGFNLIAGDASGVDVAYVHGGAEVERLELPPGVSVIANDRVGSLEFPRAELAAAAVARIATEPWPRLATELGAILSDHTMPPEEKTPVPPPGSFITAETARLVQAICIHTPRYGTRSATLAAIGPAGLAHYLVTLESPCRSPFFRVP